jgi:GAF domain-containing protein/HAMP domain-containing protein
MMSMQVEKPRTSRSLGTTLAIAFVALSVAVLLVASGFQMFFNFQTQREVVASQQQLIAQDAADTVASFIQERFGELEAAVTLGDPTFTSQEERENVVANLLRLAPAFRQLVLLDAREQELVSFSRLSQAASGNLVDRAGSDLFNQVRQGDRYIGSAYVDEVTSEPLVVIAVPATDIFGNFQGTLMAEVNLKFMWDLVGRLEIGERGLAYVVDRRGDLIAFGDVARVLKGENVGHLKEVSEFVSNPAPVDETGASISTGINGTTMVGTYVPLGTPDWAVVTELPVREAYREVIQSATLSAGVILVMATLAGLIGVYVARRLAAPLLTLTETATRIAGGEIDLQAAMEGPAEAVDLAQAFNSMTAQLREFIGSLEQRVADRTRNLQTAAEVARATTSVLDPNELLRQTVDLVRERLDLYYVGLFLLDEERRFAVLRAGTGEAGQKMLAQGHRLEVGGESMIGQCTAEAEARIALDVGEEAVRFDNPFLPETRSELALPLRSRGEIVGAMTVQSVEEAAFDEADIAVMQTMADQVAVALDNAYLFAKSQEALEATRHAYGELSREAWAGLLRARTDRGYRYASQSVTPVAGDWRPEMRQAERTGQSVQNPEGAEGGDGMPTLAIPIQVRGQVVGVLDFRKGENGERWTDEEIALLETLTDQLGVALESARLYQATQRRAAHERSVGEISDQMQRATDMETLMRITAEELNRTLSGSRAYVRLATEPSLRPPVGDGADKGDD